MATAAKPYAVLSSTAHGWLFAQVNAVPPSQPDLMSGSLSGLLLLSQVLTGALTEA